MKKLMMTLMVIAIAMTVTPAKADNVVTEKAIGPALDLLVSTNTVALNISDTYRAIERIQAKNDASGTATIVVSVSDGGVFITLGTYTLTTGTSTNHYPLRAGSYGTTSNAVPYLAQKLRFITTLGVTNTVAKPVTCRIYGKE